MCVGLNAVPCKNFVLARRDTAESEVAGSVAYGGEILGVVAPPQDIVSLPNVVMPHLFPASLLGREPNHDLTSESESGSIFLK